MMKDKACCYDCLYMKNERGIKSCKKNKQGNSKSI